MAGIYIHIPFCKQACNYCNFYFSTSPGNKEKFVQALLREIELTQNYLQGESIETIYLGGGTPSQLSQNELLLVIEKLNSIYHLSSLREFTIETNPDDLTAAKIQELKSLSRFGLNRFSIGIQSFFDEDLLYMNRAHNAEDALASVKRVQDAGFDNITIDLIYGTPTMPDDRWLQNMETAFALNVPHISSYALTVENKTPLENKIRKGVRLPVNEEQSARQFTMLMNEMKRHGFEQYEISNFARQQKYAVHNSSYWFGKKYLGLGPSAHSFNGTSRQWNVANNINYIAALQKNELSFDIEHLTRAQQTNERIMTALRTKWGLDIATCGNAHAALILQNLQGIEPSHYNLQSGVLKLTDAGKLFADSIAATLFVE